MKAYQQTIAQVIDRYNTSFNGLSDVQVQKRLQQYGPNILPDVSRETWFAIFINQFKSPLIYILLLAAIIIFIVGEDKIDAFIISGVLFFNAIIGTIQEGRTKNIVESLKRFIKTTSVVLREGEHQIVEDADIVVGDIIVLQEGQRVPADARIIEANNLQVDESVLTGESEPVFKIIEPITHKEVHLADRKNMLFKGTYVLLGSAKAIVVATGTNTQIGKIHKTITEIETEIPLKKELNRLSYIIVLFILGMCVFLFIYGIFIGKPIQELLVMLTALFICVIPEGLPIVLTLVLVSGTYRMAQQHVLAKNLQGVEALGRTDIIVIDKTGTLTRNEMLVSSVFADGIVWRVTGQGYYSQGDIYRDDKKIESIDPGSALKKVGIASSLLNNAEISFVPKLQLFEIKGDPTEAALYVLSEKLGTNRQELEQQYKKIYEIPFDSALQYHAGFYDYDNNCVIFIIGSPEVIMQRCTSITQNIQTEFTQMLEQGLRIIAVAMRTISLSTLPNKELAPREKLQAFKNLINNELEFLGLCGIQDSIRPEVPSVVEKARATGIRVIMATGDHKKTALYVAKKVGIYKPGDEALDDTEFDRLSDEQLLKKLDTITVYARLAPECKVRIINLFHKKK